MWPVNRRGTMQPRPLPASRLVPVTVLVTLLGLGARTNLVLQVCSSTCCLTSTALGTASRYPTLCVVYITVSVTLAPLSAGLMTMALGLTRLHLRVVLTTVILTWLPMSPVGPQNLSPVVTAVLVLLETWPTRIRGAPLTSLAMLEVTRTRLARY